LYGKRVVITGFRDKHLLENIEQRGAVVSSSVSKQTYVVIVKDPQQESSKTHDAKTYGVPVVSYQEFIKTHNIV